MASRWQRRFLTLAPGRASPLHGAQGSVGLAPGAGPPLWPAPTHPHPQSIPRAPSSDEECFFDLLSKFQSSRMDDQRCPLEDGQPGAAEATAAPSLEERIGEHPGGAPLGLEGAGLGAPSSPCS